MAEKPSEQFLLGDRMRTEFFGEQLVSELNQKAKDSDDIFTKTSREYITEVCFGSYDRPGLSFRERSLINIAMLTALNRGPELRIHVRAALHNGLSETEICEVCRHTMVYCGVPAGRDAMGIAGDVVRAEKSRESRG